MVIMSWRLYSTHKAASTFKHLPSIFRQSFKHETNDVLHYFPVHMAKGLQQMQRRLTQLDCIVEVHDARIPFSGRNPRFQDTLTAVKPHILVLNKMELADERLQSSVVSKLLVGGDIKRVLYTSCKQSCNSGIKHQLLSAILDVIDSADRYNRADAEDYNVLIIGVPNVGKSSLINALRQTHLHKGGRATPVGAMPGVTRSVMERIKVSERPKVYVYDTPGIMLPIIPDMDVAMKLALCAMLKDQQVGTVRVADYMLFWLNKMKMFKYVELFDMPEPVDDVHVLLTYVAKKRNLVLKVKSPSDTGLPSNRRRETRTSWGLEVFGHPMEGVQSTGNSGGGYVFRPNYEQAASIALQDFRSGILGKIILDIDMLNVENRSTSCNLSSDRTSRKRSHE